MKICIVAENREARRGQAMARRRTRRRAGTTRTKEVTGRSMARTEATTSTGRTAATRREEAAERTTARVTIWGVFFSV